MLITKKTSVAGAYIRKKPYDYEGKHYEADVKNGDVVTILDEGNVVSGQYGEQYVFKLQTRNGEKNANFNQTTLNTLHDAFGKDSAEWVNKEVVCHLIKTMVSGKLQDVLYLAPIGWEMDENGRFTNVEGASQLPQADGEEEINLDDIPF